MCEVEVQRLFLAFGLICRVKQVRERLLPNDNLGKLGKLKNKTENVSRLFWKEVAVFNERENALQASKMCKNKSSRTINFL